MPLVVGIEVFTDPDPLLNGVTIDLGKRGLRTYTYGDIPANVRAQSLTQQEDWLKAFAESEINQYVGVHIISLSPFRWIFCISQDPVPAGWWNVSLP